MWSLLVFPIILFTTNVHCSVYRECGKYFNPLNYMNQLPSLSLPYVSSVPSIVPNIKPSAVATTKVINIVTQYVYKSPVCVKITGKKSFCKSSSAGSNNIENLVTKELFVRDRLSKRINDLEMYIEASEQSRPFDKQEKTPTLTPAVKDMLIEDRLDQLETILPYYTRRRVFETSTITVTKVKSNNRATATLLVKNCIPQGFDLCTPKIKKRKSRVAEPSNNTDINYFG